MKKKIKFLLIAFVILIYPSCQTLPETVPPSQTSTSKPSMSQLPTETAQAAPTFQSLSAESLAGLIISSPILGSPYEVPGVQPSEIVTSNGLGIINSEGELINFSEAGLFEGFSPSGAQIVYQHGFEDDYTDYIDNLYVYNSTTGQTVEILDDLENEGGKTVLSWLQDEQKFVYYNDYLTVLFEAYGYFGAKQLLLADTKTGQTTLLINDGYQFDVSPSQTQIAYTTGDVLDLKTKAYGGQLLEVFGCFQPHIYNIASSATQPFDMSQLKEKPVCLGYPKWSPDGKKIAWMGYFADDAFHPVIFNLQDGGGTIYDAIDQKPESSLFPTSWFFGNRYSEPDWLDNFTFWTPAYEVNVETGETFTPRKINPTYNPRRDEYLVSPNGLFDVSLNEERNAIKLNDINGNVLTFIFPDDIYNRPKHEILTNGLFLLGKTNIVGWSPFAPLSTAGVNKSP